MSKTCFELFVQAGGQLVIQIPTSTGGENLVISSGQALRYLADPVAFSAQLCGVSRAEYTAWLEQHRSVRCCATTRKGRRCRSIARGGSMVDPKTWVSMQGSYCYTHEEGRLG
mgnify:CR=1 FL=1